MNRIKIGDTVYFYSPWYDKFFSAIVQDIGFRLHIDGYKSIDGYMTYTKKTYLDPMNSYKSLDEAKKNVFLRKLKKCQN